MPATSVPAGKPELIVTPETSLMGKVLRVNEPGRFVVLVFPPGRMPELQERLSVYHLGLKSGELRVSGPQLDESVVADVIKGQAAVGDEVRDQ